MSTFQPIALPANNYRILIVDDDEGCAKMLMWTLEDLGQKAKIAYYGLTAIELANSFCPELILLDISLPGMNGYEICAALRKNPTLNNTFIVAQTGWGEKQHRERTKEAGFDHHLVKPITSEALKSILLLVDQRRTLTEELSDHNLEKVKNVK